MTEPDPDRDAAAAHDSDGEDGSDRPGEDAAWADSWADSWADIVAHYGERPVLEGRDLEPSPTPFPEPEREPEAEVYVEDEEGFVPPPVGPAGHPHGPRLLAWLGLLGSPLLAIVLVMLIGSIPGLASFALLAAFVGGFCYLVATMRTEPRDDGDDGAVL